MMQILGAIGSLCFEFCLLPQVIKVYRQKTAQGLSWLFLLLSAGGNVASCGYVAYANYISGIWKYTLYFNYGFAFVLCVLLIIAKVKYGSFLGLKDLYEIILDKEFEGEFDYPEFEAGVIRPLTAEKIIEHQKKRDL